MNLKFFQSRSIKTRVTLFTLAIFILSIWAISLHISRTLQGDMQRVLGEQHFQTASMVADAINTDVQDRLRTLEMLAKILGPVVPGGAEKIQEALENRPALHGPFNSGSFVTGMDGTALASFPVSTGRTGINFLERDFVAAALKEGKSSVSKPVIDKVLKKPVLSMAAPIRDPQGQVIGALVGVIDLDKPDFLDKISKASFNKTGTVSIISPQHRMTVASSDKRLVMQALPLPGVNPYLDRNMAGFEGYTTVVNVLGQKQLASVKQIPSAQWYLYSGLPIEEVFAPVRAMQHRILLAAILLTLLAGIFIWWMLRRELAPVFDTARALAHMAEATETPQPLPVTRQDEIGQLIGGFNRLLETLSSRETALIEREGRLNEAQRMAKVGNWDLNFPDNHLAWSDEIFRIFEIDKTQFKATYEAFLATIHPDDRDAVNAAYTQSLETRAPYGIEHRLLFTNGHVKYVLEQCQTTFSDTGQPLRSMGTVQDITERKQAEAQHQLAASVFVNAGEGITITDVQGTIIEVNQAFSRITGYSREEAIGQNPRILKSGRQDKAFYEAMWRDVTEQGHWSGEVWNRRRDGEVYAELLTISAVRDAAGAAQHYVGLFTDITAIKAHQKQLEHIAHFDALTNLPNRVLLADRLQQAMAQMQRRGQHLAVAYLDLDGFKAINDKHGHDTGDQVLIILSQYMKDALREGDTLARLGGDEFVAVLIDLQDPSDCLPLCDRLLAQVAQPIQVADLTLQVSASIGITFYPQKQDIDADQLLRQADQAMYQAKVAGKNRYHLFDAEQDHSIRGHHESLERIRLALAQGEFVLYYQPKVNMHSGQVIGAEALIRWQHPEKGLVAPAVFLPVIEDDPLAVLVGEWVIDTALSQMELWHAAGLDLPVSVNIGARQLQQGDFVARLQSILEKHPHVSPANLELEVLETSALADIAQVSQVIEDCTQMGVMFALDDFGTGYSSLTYLKQLRVAMLKIDRSFVRDMLDDPDDLAILQGVIGLAEAFKRDVIAEGVETVEHGTALLQLGCELAQGYGIARPMPAEKMPDWVSTWRPDAAWCQLP